MKDFFADYRCSPSILNPHIESAGNKGNERNTPDIFDEIKANSVSLPPVTVSLDAQQGNKQPCAVSLAAEPGNTGETEISSQTQRVSEVVSFVFPVSSSRHVEPQNRENAHNVVYLKAGVGDEGKSAGVYSLLCDLRRQGVSVRAIEDGRLAVSPARLVTGSELRQLKLCQRAIRGLLPSMLTPEEIKASAERMGVAGQRWLADNDPEHGGDGR